MWAFIIPDQDFIVQRPVIVLWVRLGIITPLLCARDSILIIMVLGIGDKIGANNVKNSQQKDFLFKKKTVHLLPKLIRR